MAQWRAALCRSDPLHVLDWLVMFSHVHLEGLGDGVSKVRLYNEAADRAALHAFAVLNEVRSELLFWHTQ